MSEPKNILIIQTAFLGDIALSLFLVAEVRASFPNCKITFVTTPVGAELCRCFSLIDNIIAFDKRNKHKGIKGIRYIIKQIRSICPHFDYIFALQRSIRSTLISKLLNADTKIGFSNANLSCLYDKKVTYQPNIHEVERNRKFLSYVGETSEFNYTTFTNIISQNYTSSLPQVPQNHIVIAPCSVWKTKQWLPEYFSQLCSLLSQHKIIILGSQKENDVCEEIANANPNTENLAGKTNINEMLQLIKNAKLVIANDSAPTHIASLFNVPTSTIFGSTVPSFGFTPLANKHKIIEAELKCRPCGTHGSNKCNNHNSMECMKLITPKEVYDNLQKM